MVCYCKEGRKRMGTRQYELCCTWMKSSWEILRALERSERLWPATNCCRPRSRAASDSSSSAVPFLFFSFLTFSFDLSPYQSSEFEENKEEVITIYGSNGEEEVVHVYPYWKGRSRNEIVYVHNNKYIILIYNFRIGNLIIYRNMVRKLVSKHLPYI